jgi:plastocyanin
MKDAFFLNRAGMLAMMLGTLCHASSAATPAAAAVVIRNYHFVPETLKIPVGSSVTWTNKDDDPHTVMSATGAFRSSVIDTDQAFSYTFTKPGVYRIACSLHPQMFETIVVE